jgi:hypothetical protein
MALKNLQSLVLRNAFNTNVNATGLDGRGFTAAKVRHPASSWYPMPTEGTERRDTLSTAETVSKRTGRSVGRLGASVRIGCAQQLNTIR